MGMATHAVQICNYPDLPDHFNATVVPVDKPKDWSSFRVVKKLRWLTRVKKVGHAGTLDPMATGLLICLVGKATKQMETFMHLPKTYEGTIRLGEQTPSYDAETEVTEQKSVDHLDDVTIREACDTFLGEITQLPPMYSAVKIGGERLYKKARRGEVVERRPRIVNVSQFDVTPRTGRDVSFVISCSKGTYIRSIAHDLGEYLGVGGHLVALRRTAIGDFSIDDAWPLEELEQRILSQREA